ncbi:MAG: capsular biosynthesis protein CpsI [Phenylobacterium sp. RIFCSPHIGHO2_01_FULL_69_31]|uniref:NAD-dependent epimerase n=1 Tax=Phenylobacterium sp. RIFCSPHIGHO2_01_FULL_69_31 TaxID=1801944 RepID=UPI0008B2FBBA|nr:NAD-dependent epimerase [Phenylobacterium sp. RIFCSPHIGHO2_01_FULL_69_31]OHB26376.1 MAG: capsular biosynthesis protein CpsI [Phenylobacterium sp. RIFCSPHIGHO2_01_FULL_69_31]
MTILVTGSAGFIGFHLSRRLLERGETVVGLDSLNAYYDPKLKAARLAILESHRGYRHAKLDLADREGVPALFAEVRPDHVVNLAAQAGVRYSLESPETYVDSNVVGFLNILEGCRAVQPKHLVFASTSSVYGNHNNLPFNVHDAATHPITLYAASKLANEAMAHSYAHLFGIPSTGFRFFTVYGPWGRPDMALFKFTDAILKGQPIDVYGEGRMQRDFTYVDDIVDGLVAALDRPPAANPAWDSERPDPATSAAPWRVLNLGASRRVELMRYIQVLEEKLGRKADLNLMPMQAGDVARTEADTAETRAVLDYAPSTTIEEGVGRFVDWYREYYGV